MFFSSWRRSPPGSNLFYSSAASDGYKRQFLTYVEEKRTVSVRHIAHDEWPRSYSISAAWPWLSGIGATVTGFVGFAAVWMYSKPADKKRA
ncbi:hypothetical protein C2W62_47650 [Candidatus Entotheonella serta]|nr:hypothetical protein C2W62_47650 [Candidatus Entotheonella serta]